MRAESRFFWLCFFVDVHWWAVADPVGFRGLPVQGVSGFWENNVEFGKNQLYLFWLETSPVRAVDIFSERWMLLRCLILLHHHCHVTSRHNQTRYLLHHWIVGPSATPSSMHDTKGSAEYRLREVIWWAFVVRSQTVHFLLKQNYLTRMVLVWINILRLCLFYKYT